MKAIWSQRLSPIGLFIALCILLIWPALLNGSPFYFPDTTAYIKGAAAGVLKFTGLHSAWLDGEPVLTAMSGMGFPLTGTGAAPVVPAAPSVTVLSGRSVYYGGVVLVTQFFNSWLAILWQAAVAVYIVCLTVRRSTTQLTTAGAPLRPATVVVLLAAFTALPFFCSMQMPDLFASLAILSTAALLSLPCKTEDRVAYLLVIAGAALFHSANVLLCLVLAVGYLLCWSLSSPSHDRLRPTLAMAVIAAAGVGIAGELAFQVVTERAVGTSPLRPPFLSARLIADGPGEDYLRQHCTATNRWRLCNFVSRPMDRNSDLLLWSKDPNIGIFTAASSTDRALISAQDTQFAWAVVREYPVRLLQIALNNVAQQLFLLDLQEFNASAGDIEIYQAKLPQSEFKALLKSRAARNDFPDGTFAAVQQVALAVSACALLYLLMWRRQQIAHARMASFFWLCVSGVLVNAVLCGVLSTPHSRYQARVAWLIVFLALVLIRIPTRTRSANQPENQAVAAVR